MILGDDVVIFNSAVGASYKDIITSLGVSISLTKRVSPKDALIRSEFASKLVCNGINISPLPLGLLFQFKSEDLFKFLLAYLERGHYHGGAALSENLLECTFQWLIGIPVKGSDFYNPVDREDLLSFIGFYIGYSSYLKIRRASNILQGEKLEKEHTTFVNSLFSGSSLGVFLSGVPFSFWVKVHNLLQEGTQMTFKIGVSTVRKIVKDPSLFITRVCKDSNLKVDLRNFLLRDQSKPMINLLNSPYYEVYIEVSRKFRKTLMRESLGGMNLIPIHPEFGTLEFPTRENIIRFFLSKDLPYTLLSTIEDSTLIEDITKLTLGPKVLVREFRKNSFSSTTRRLNTLTHVSAEISIEISRLFRVLIKLGYFKS